MVKMPVLPNLTYRFNAISTKISVSYFLDIDKLILKFIWRGKDRIANSVLKENKARKMTLLDLENYSNQDSTVLARE